MAGRPLRRARLNRKTPPRGGGGRGRKSLLAHLKGIRQYILDADRDGIFESEPPQVALGPVMVDLEEAIDYLERSP